MASQPVVEKVQPNSGIMILVVLLYAPGKTGKINEPICGITRLDKLMFLLSMEERFEKQVKDYQFEAYSYGPFATELFDDLEALISQKIAMRTPREEPKSAIQTKDAEWIEDQTYEADETLSWAHTTVDEYKLTQKGLEIGKVLYSGLTAEQKEVLTKIKVRFNPMELRLLLRFVYQKYPDFAEKSKIRKRYLY